MANNIFKSFWNYIREPDFNKNREIGAYDVVTKSSKKANDLSPGDKIMVHGEKLEVKAVRVREGGEGFIYFTDGSKTNTSDDTSYEIVKSHDRVSASPEDETPIGEQNQEKKKNTLSDQEQNNSHPYNERTMGGSKMLTEASEAKVHMNKATDEDEKIIELFEEGLNPRKIAEELDIPLQHVQNVLYDSHQFKSQTVAKALGKYVDDKELENKVYEHAMGKFINEDANFGGALGSCLDKFGKRLSENRISVIVHNAKNEFDSEKKNLRFKSISKSLGDFIEKAEKLGGAEGMTQKELDRYFSLDRKFLAMATGKTKMSEAEKTELQELSKKYKRNFKPAWKSIGDSSFKSSSDTLTKSEIEAIDKEIAKSKENTQVSYHVEYISPKGKRLFSSNVSGWFRDASKETLERYERRSYSADTAGLTKEDTVKITNVKVMTTGKTTKDVGVANAGPVPNSLLAAQDLEGGTETTKASKDDVKWITVGGKRVPIKPGQDKGEAVRSAVGDKKKPGSKGKEHPNKELVGYGWTQDKWQLLGKYPKGEYEVVEANDDGSIIIERLENEKRYKLSEADVKRAGLSKSIINKAELSVFDRNQLKVARQVLNMPDAAIAFSGANMTKKEAEEIVQRLEEKKKKSIVNKTLGNYFAKLGIEPYGQAYKESEETPTFDDIKEVADGETPDEGSGAIQNIEDLTGDGAKTKSLESDLDSLIERWKRTGRVAFKHPKKQTVSFNGGKERPYDDALEYLEDFFESSDKEKTQKSASYSGWEDMIITSIENLLEVTRSDAQGIVEAQEFLLAQEWAKGTPSYQVAKLIASKSSLKTQKAGKKTNYRGHTITEENGSFAVDDNAEYDTMEQAKRVIDRGEDEDKDNHDTDKARKVGKSLGDFLKKGNYDEEIEGEQSDKENYERLAEENPTDAPVLEAISNQEAGHKRALEILDKEKSSPDPKDDPENRKPEDESSTEKGMDAKNYHIYSTTEGKGLVWYVVDIESGDEFGPLGSHEAAERYIQSEVEKGRSDKTNKNMKTTNKESFRDYDNIGLVSPGIVLTKYGEVSSIKWIDNANSGLGGWKVTFKDGSQKMFRPGEVVRISRTKKSVDRVGKPEVELVEDQFETQDENSNGGLMIRDLVNTAVQLRREMKSDQRIRMTLMQDFGLRGSQLEEVIELANNTILAEGGVEQDPSRVLDKSFTKSYTEMKQGKDLKIVNPHKVNKFRDFWLGK